MSPCGADRGARLLRLQREGRERTSILYNDEVRDLLIDFMARKVSVMGEELRAKNPDAFMFVDEPGMEFIFSSLSGTPRRRPGATSTAFFRS